MPFELVRARKPPLAVLEITLVWFLTLGKTHMLFEMILQTCAPWRQSPGPEAGGGTAVGTEPPGTRRGSGPGAEDSHSPQNTERGSFLLVKWAKL